MSDLQIGLIILGIVLILLVLGFNWWQDRRVRRRMQAHFAPNEHDPLLGASGGAAGQGAGHSASHHQQVPAALRREPGFNVGDTQGGPAGRGASATVPANSEQDDADEADPATEIVIEVNFGEPVKGADLLPHVQGIRLAGRKPLRVFAQTEQQRHRSRVHPEESYVSVQIAVLLANRTGPLTAIEWSHAWARAQDLADRFEGSIESPDQQAVLERAARLDDTCAALDTQVGLTLLLGSAQPAAEVLAVARDLGFVHDGNRLAWMSEEGIPRFTLTRADGTAFDAGMAGVERLNLLLDVPCSPPDAHAFGHMVEVGRKLAERLRADLVDDQGKPLADASASVIDERLQVLFTQLEQAGLRAGSPRALRVFS
jgi:hypothetical protein